MNKIEQMHFHVEGQEVEWPYQAHFNITEEIAIKFAVWCSKNRWERDFGEGLPSSGKWWRSVDAARSVEFKTDIELFAEFIKTL